MKMSYQEKLEYNRQYYLLNKEKVQAKRKQTRNTTVRGRMRAINGNACARAKKEGWEYDLTLDFLCDVWERQQGLCGITGTPLSLQASDTRWNSNIASLDRIDSSRGYTQDNVWLVCASVNYAKGTQSLSDFIEMCKLVVENNK